MIDDHKTRTIQYAYQRYIEYSYDWYKTILQEREVPEDERRRIDGMWSRLMQNGAEGFFVDEASVPEDEIDFEIWIPETGAPLPVRLTITYRDEEGQPRFWADFENWNMTPAVADADFTFTPPQDAERIPFLVEIERALGERKSKGDD